MPFEPHLPSVWTGSRVIINHRQGLGQRLKRPRAQGVPTSSSRPEGQPDTQVRACPKPSDLYSPLAPGLSWALPLLQGTQPF